MSAIELITVQLEGGEKITMSSNDVQWFTRDGLCVGRVSTQQFLAFLRDKISELKEEK